MRTIQAGASCALSRRARLRWCAYARVGLGGEDVRTLLRQRRHLRSGEGRRHVAPLRAGRFHAGMQLDVLTAFSGSNFLDFSCRRLDWKTGEGSETGAFFAAIADYLLRL